MMEIRVDMIGKACLTGSDDRWITLETDDDYCDEKHSVVRACDELHHSAWCRSWDRHPRASLER